MGNQFSRLPPGYQSGVDSWYGVVCTNFHFVPDFRESDTRDYLFKNCIYTSSFIGLLLLLSWWCGQAGCEKGVDPVEAASKERNDAIKERIGAQRAWGEMVIKHERAIETNLELQAEFSKAFKDLPWLEQKNFELAEQNTVQYNEIEHLKIFKEKYDELLHQVCIYGMSAKRPEYHQQRSEQVQRQLEISNNLLKKSEKSVKALEEKLETRNHKASEETTWLRAQLKKNSRSAAYWAKQRSDSGTMESTPAWGIRCACTEPEIAFSLKDQSPRIVELEATVAARDLTITHLRESRFVRNFSKNSAASTSNTAKVSLPSIDDSRSDYIAESETVSTTHERDEQCETLSKQVADDAKTIEQLREECQKLKHAASNDVTMDAAEIIAKAEIDEEVTAKDTMIQDLRKQLAAKNETIIDLQKEKATSDDELAENSQAIKGLRDEEKTTDEELNAKNEEIDKLREEMTAAAEKATTEVSNLGQQLSESRKDLEDAREERADCERELGRRDTRVDELETAQFGLEDIIKQKDREIEDLEVANQELAEQPDPESAENLQRLTTANTSLDQLSREYAECKGQSETQTARINELEAAEREVGETIKVKDDRIARLEQQVNNAPSNELIERQTQSHDAAIRQRDEHYQALHDLYEKVLGQQRLAEAQHNADIQSLNTVQQSDTAKQFELQRLWTEYQNFRGNCDTRMTDLTNQLRQGANIHTDLQIKYNTQTTELEVANQNAHELQSETVKLQQMITSLEQMNSSSEGNFESYRVEGENRARPIWQAALDRELSAQALKLKASEEQVFKLQSQLQQAKTQASPLREMQIKEREDAVKLREDALKPATDAMDHDQQGCQVDQEIKTLEVKLAAANKEAGDAKTRNRGIQNLLTKEKKERTEEQVKHEKALKKEQENSKKSIEILRVRLEQDNPLKGALSKLQNEVMRLSKELEEQKARGNDG